MKFLFIMNTKAQTLVKTNQHYQVTIPLKIRKQFSIDRGSLFIAEATDKGILFKPTKIENFDSEYADPLTKQETQDLKEALNDIKEGRYTTITSVKQLKEHLDALK